MNDLSKLYNVRAKILIGDNYETIWDNDSFILSAFNHRDVELKAIEFLHNKHRIGESEVKEIHLTPLDMKDGWVCGSVLVSYDYKVCSNNSGHYRFDIEFKEIEETGKMY